jgi:hypothetical protein
VRNNSRFKQDRQDIQDGYEESENNLNAEYADTQGKETVFALLSVLCVKTILFILSILLNFLFKTTNSSV